MTYKECIKDILSLKNVSEDKIFDFSDDKYKVRFDSLFAFYSENLNRNVYYGIDPSYFYFYKEDKINAQASKINGQHFIRINSGTIKELIRIFLETDQIISESWNEKLKALMSKLDNPINEIMYQACTHFTFYHELGHLAQYSKLLEQGLNEDLTKVEKFNRKLHVYEIDADMFACVSMSSHILQYASRIFGGSPKQKEFEDLAIILTSAVFTYVLAFPSNRKPLYFEDHSHPHPFIRSLISLDTILSSLSQAVKAKGFDFTLNQKRILEESLSLSEEVFGKAYKSKYFDKTKQEFKSNTEKILQYCKTLVDLAMEDKTLSIPKRNNFRKIRIETQEMANNNPEKLTFYLDKELSEQQIFEIKYLAGSIDESIEVEPEKHISGLAISTIGTFSILTVALIQLGYTIKNEMHKGREANYWTKDRLTEIIQNKLLEYDEIVSPEIDIINFKGLIDNTYSPCHVTAKIEDKEYKFAIYNNGDIFRINKSA